MSYFEFIILELTFLIFLIPYLYFEKKFPAQKIEKEFLFENIKYLFIWILINAAIGYFITRPYIDPIREIVRLHIVIHLSVSNIIVVTLINLFIFDCCYYWFHRFSHKYLWFHHGFHHSDQNINVTTTWRHHFLENIYIIPFTFIPTTIILIDLNSSIGDQLVVIGIAKFIAYAGIFSHANIKLEAGFFNYFFTNPQWHRIHHSRYRNHMNRNFAAYFPILDLIFGTFYMPKKNEWPETGLDENSRAPYSLMYMLAFPIDKFFFKKSTDEARNL